MLLPALTFLAASVLLPADEVTYEQINKSSATQELAFDWTAQDELGNPTTAKRAEFLFREHPVPTDPDPATIIPTATAPVEGENRYLVRQIAATLPPGTYKLNVRIVNAADLVGSQSLPIYVEVVDEKKPVAPTGLRVIGQP